jgi:hypothetical protein
MIRKVSREELCADLGDWAVSGGDLQILDCTIAKVESRRGHEYPSLVIFVFVVVYCVGSGLCDGLITHSGEYYSVCVCAQERERETELGTTTMRWPGDVVGCCGLLWVVVSCCGLLWAVAGSLYHHRKIVWRIKQFLRYVIVNLALYTRKYIRNSFFSRCHYSYNSIQQFLLPLLLQQYPTVSSPAVTTTLLNSFFSRCHYNSTQQFLLPLSIQQYPTVSSPAVTTTLPNSFFSHCHYNSTQQFLFPLSLQQYPTVSSTAFTTTVPNHFFSRCHYNSTQQFLLPLSLQ